MLLRVAGLHQAVRRSAHVRSFAVGVSISSRIERRNVSERCMSSKSGGVDFATMLRNMKGGDKNKEQQGGATSSGSKASVATAGLDYDNANDSQKAADSKEAPKPVVDNEEDTNSEETPGVGTVQDGKVREESEEQKAGEGEGQEETDKDEEETEPQETMFDRIRNQVNSFDMSNFIKSVPSRSRLYFSDLIEGTKLAWDELRDPKKVSSLKRKVHQADSYKKAHVEGNEDEGDEKEKPVKEKGPSAIVQVKEAGSQWDAMRARLADSPIIREIFKRSKGAYKAATATDAGAAAAQAAENVKNKVHDAREFWETSQNPLVYTLSGVWDNVTGDTEESLVTKEILKLDPEFMKEEWLEELRTDLVPKTITSHLEGDIKFLKLHCGEACFAKLSNDIKTRAADKVVFESKMVDLDESMVSLKFLESGAPVIVCMYTVQQINIIRKDGEIIDGDPDQVIARFYSMAFQQEYDEVDEVVRWHITDYEYGGDIPYY